MAPWRLEAQLQRQLKEFKATNWEDVGIWVWLTFSSAATTGLVYFCICQGSMLGPYFGATPIYVQFELEEDRPIGAIQIAEFVISGYRYCHLHCGNDP